MSAADRPEPDAAVWCVQDWTLVLDALEAQLDRQEQAMLHGGEPPDDVVVGWPDRAPTDAERTRAIALLERQEALLDQMVQRLARRARRPSAAYR